MSTRCAFRCFKISLLCLLVTAIGCGGGLDRFPTAATTGVVTCNGKPVEFALVFFEPIKSGGTSAIVGKQGADVTDAEGKFSISTYGEGDGAVVGKHRVRVGAPMRSGWSCDCRTDAEFDLMEIDIVEGQDNHFEIALPKKPRNARPPIDEFEEDDEDLE